MCCCWATDQITLARPCFQLPLGNESLHIFGRNHGPWTHHGRASLFLDLQATLRKKQSPIGACLFLGDPNISGGLPSGFPVNHNHGVPTTGATWSHPFCRFLVSRLGPPWRGSCWWRTLTAPPPSRPWRSGRASSKQRLTARVPGLHTLWEDYLRQFLFVAPLRK